MTNNAFLLPGMVAFMQIYYGTYYIYVMYIYTYIETLIVKLVHVWYNGLQQIIHLYCESM